MHDRHSPRSLGRKNAAQAVSHGLCRLAALGLALVLTVGLAFEVLASGGLASYSSSVRNGSILMARYPAPSPDGGQIAFGYRGDLWVVPSAGGQAQRITASPGKEYYPVWSPEGTRIAFAATPDGNADVYTVSLGGGPPQRLTFGSWNDYPACWTPDGGAVLFESSRYLSDGRNAETYLVRYEGGNPVRVMPGGGSAPALSPDGQSLLFERGSTSWWRTGYEGPGKARLWIFDMDRKLNGLPILQQIEPPVSIDAPETLMGELAALCLRPEGLYRDLTGMKSDEGVRRSFERDREQTPEFDSVEQEFGGNSHPQWFPDGVHVLYLSESHGIANLKVIDSRTGTRAWVTRFEDGRLRNPSLSRDGSLVAFEYNEGVYTVALPPELPTAESPNWVVEPSTPAFLNIQIPFDFQTPVLERFTVSSGASEMELSPDDEQIAFVYEGDVFAMKASEDEPYAYALTETPFRENGVIWSPDSKSVVFVSDQSGNKDIYSITSADEGEERLARALHRETAQLTTDEEDEREPQFSPDGKRIAFIRGLGTLMTMAADGSDEKVIVEGWADLDFMWSPDSRWIVFAREDNDFNSDVWVVPVDASREPYNISRHPDDDSAPYWSKDGKIIAFVSDRRFPSETDIWYVRLTREDDELSKEDRLDQKTGDKKPSDEKSKKGDADDDDDKKSAEDVTPVEIDFEGIHERMTRLTSFPGNESFVLVSNDSDEFVFSSDTDGERDLWKVKWDGSDEERLTTGGTSPRSVQWDKAGKKLFYRHGKGRFSSISASGGSKTSYSYSSQVSVDRAAQRQAVLREAWRELGMRFYDPEMHGADWPKALQTYLPWAAAASTYSDYRDVVKMMLGELRGSHLNIYGGPEGYESDRREGIEDDLEIAREEADGSSYADVTSWGRSRAADDPAEAGEDRLEGESGELGVFLDPRHDGPGQRVAFVVPGSPAARVATELAVGDIILSVDGRPIDVTSNVYESLERTVNRRVLLRVRSGKKERDVAIRPVSTRELRNLLYDHAVDLRQERVREMSDGRVAYVHIRSMGVSSLEAFERDLYAQAHGSDALIIDVRDNGGGWTTDLMMTSIAAADHAITVPREGGNGYPEDRRLIFAWNRPIVAMCNENSFSNAEIFSWAIQVTERGPVVGTQTYGGVISTGGTYLGDGHWLRLPFRGWYTKKDGTNMEEFGCTPDIVVPNLPPMLLQGQDPQLRAAIEAALEQLR